MSRRSLLKVAGTTAGVAGFGGIASAAEEGAGPTDVMAPEFRDPGRIHETIEAEAQPVLDRLADAGYLDTASVEELPYSTKHPNPTFVEPADRREGVAASTFVRDGEESAIVAVSKNVEGGTMTLYVRPGESAKARLSLDDGTEKLVDETRDDATIQGCGTTSYCTDEMCDSTTVGMCQYQYHTKIREECCQFPDGSHDCTVQGTTCECAEKSGVC